MKKILFLITVVFWFTQTVSAQSVLPLRTRVDSSPSFASDHVLVVFKPGQSKKALDVKVTERKVQRDTLTGALAQAISDSIARIQGEKLPETQLSDITNLENQLSVQVNTTGLQTASTFDVIKSKNSTALDVNGVIGAFGKLSEVVVVQPDYIRSVQVIPNDQKYSQMWNLSKIQMSQAWDNTKGSATVTVAVIDTGVQADHPDFAGRQFVNGRDFVQCDKYQCDAQGNCDTTKCLVVRSCPQLANGYCSDNFSDDEGHGTHVTGTIGASTNNLIGIAGINWYVAILPIKVMNSQGVGLTSWIIDGINYAVSHGAKVINLSLGGPPGCASDPVTQQAITNAVNAGVTVVVAAGNENQDAGNVTPASCNGVIAVAATGPNDELASYSNYGNVVALAAPGGNPARGVRCNASSCITSTYIGSQYAFAAGTSMASPHVAGAVALMLALQPNLSSNQIKSILTSSINVDPVKNTNGKQVGGRLNVYKALLAISGTTTPAATSTLAPGVSPTITSPQPTGVSPTQSPPAINPKCICNNNNICTSQCTFDKFQKVSYPSQIKCVTSSSATKEEKTSFCQRPERLIGDVNGDRQVNYLDYFYYVQAAGGGQVPVSVNADVNGNGRVDQNDSAIILMNLNGNGNLIIPSPPAKATPTPLCLPNSTNRCEFPGAGSGGGGSGGGNPTIAPTSSAGLCHGDSDCSSHKHCDQGNCRWNPDCGGGCCIGVNPACPSKAP